MTSSVPSSAHSMACACRAAFRATPAFLSALLTASSCWHAALSTLSGTQSACSDEAAPLSAQHGMRNREAFCIMPCFLRARQTASSCWQAALSTPLGSQSACKGRLPFTTARPVGLYAQNRKPATHHKPSARDAMRPSPPCGDPSLQPDVAVPVTLHGAISTREPSCQCMLASTWGPLHRQPHDCSNYPPERSHGQD